MPELNAKDIRNLVGPSPVILEIGCNDGTDTLRFLEEMPEAKITCFECDPRAIDRFCRHGPVGARLVQAAVCDVDGTAIFHGSSGQPPNVTERSPHYCRLPEWDLSGSLYEASGHVDYCRWCTFPKDREFTVQTIRLDTWFKLQQDIDHIDFIWMDVQGAEASVILGASHTLCLTRYLYTEYYDKPLYAGQVSLQTLKCLLPGFEFVSKHTDNVLFKNRDLQ